MTPFICHHFKRWLCRSNLKEIRSHAFLRAKNSTHQSQDRAFGNFQLMTPLHWHRIMERLRNYKCRNAQLLNKLNVTLTLIISFLPPSILLTALLTFFAFFMLPLTPLSCEI